MVFLSLFPRGILGQVWYLIVSIPDLCPLNYFIQIFIEHSATSDLDLHCLHMSLDEKKTTYICNVLNSLKRQ